LARYALDASFVLGWLIPAQRTPLIRERWLSFAAGDELLAPALLLSECTSILHEQARARAITRDLARHLVQTLLRLPIGIVDRRDIYLRAFEIASELNWEKAYDGVYVAAAELEGGELLTLDGDMHRGALQLSIPSTLMR